MQDVEDPLLLVFPPAFEQFQPLKLQKNALLLELGIGLPLGTGSYGKVVRGISLCLVICKLSQLSRAMYICSGNEVDRACAGRWQGSPVAVKQILHQENPSASSLVVSQECIIALLMAHPNHVGRRKVP